ncbi:MAG: hypothetical protein JOZ47_01615 [Kutzneria sp.]|nr:hypothetical protein [Kutzneria sp.]
MSVRCVVGMVLVLAATVMAATPTGATTLRTPEACAASLDCPASELGGFSASQRLAFVRLVESTQLPHIVPGAAPWRNIEGVLEMFRDRDVLVPGDWTSIVDSSILEGVERGTALALKLSQDTFGNPGSALWASYLEQLRDGQLTQRGVHDAAWSRAEQASTDHGVAVAAAVGMKPSGRQWRFYEFTELYRWTLRNEPTVLLALAGPLVSPRIRELRVPFLTWFTDVSNDVPAYHGSALAWSLSEPDPVQGANDAVALLLAYLPNLFDDFQRDVGG